MSNKCLCITASGKRCSREGKYSGYCFQHNKKCVKSITAATSKKSTKSKVTKPKVIKSKVIKPG